MKRGGVEFWITLCFALCFDDHLTQGKVPAGRSGIAGSNFGQRPLDRVRHRCDWRSSLPPIANLWLLSILLQNWLIFIGK
jgi:hypothetical protein